MNFTRCALTFVGFHLSLASAAVAQHEHDSPAEPTSHESPEAALDETSDTVPPVPDGMTVEDTLDAAAAGPPDTWPVPVHDNPTLSFTLFEQLEYRSSDDQADQFGWDAQGWIGNDDNKFWWKSEGSIALDGSSEGDTEVQALYATPLTAFWFAQAGVRYEHAWTSGDSQDRWSLALGVQGLAPYRFELEPTLFITEDGDFLGRLTASYDTYLTQRLVLQPRAELNLSAQDVPDYGLGAGLNDVTLELRLRYEVEREFAPYVGLRYSTFLGETADITRRGGSPTDDLQIVFGVRLAF